jgi:peptidyl-prolyl cis-trans isomerase SurA
MKMNLSRKLLLFAAAVGIIVALILPRSLIAANKSQIVEEIVARVNDDIITLSDYQKAEESLPAEVKQDCDNCTPDQINAMLTSEKKNLLRSLIDSSLLIQRAKDLGISVDTDVVKRLDSIRVQNGLPSMDALQKAVESEGLDWEDYKERIKNNLLTQRVIQQEVGGSIKIGTEDAQKYYEAHKSEFVRPEEVDISDIYFNTKGKSPEETATIEQKAETVLKRLQAGEDFAALARRNSDGPTATDGGELGLFKRGVLVPAIEKAVFALKHNEITGLIHTTDGIEILKLNEHYDEGLQPLSKVENDIEEKLYEQRIQPAMRTYLDKLRRDSYVVVKPGYVDTGSTGGSNVIQEISPNSDQIKTKRKTKKVNG